MEILHVQVALQGLAAVSIFGALVYAALQFREWRKAQHVANFTKLVELQMSLRRMRVEQPALAEVYKHDVEHLSGEREIREYFMNLMQVSLFEIVWFSRRQGQLPEDYFESWARRMRAIAAEDSFQRMIRNPSMKIMHDEFQEYLMDLAEHAATNAARGAQA